MSTVGYIVRASGGRTIGFFMAPKRTRTLGLRNFMAYEIFREGMGRYASRAKFVELFLVVSSGAGDKGSRGRASTASTTDADPAAAGGPSADDPRYLGLYMLGRRSRAGPTES